MYAVSSCSPHVEVTLTAVHDAIPTANFGGASGNRPAAPRRAVLDRAYEPRRCGVPRSPQSRPELRAPEFGETV